MKKRILALLLTLCMALTLLPGMALAADAASGSVGGVTWVIGEDGTMTFSGSGAIPENFSYANMPYNDDYANYAQWLALVRSVKKIVVEDGITEIGDFAFEHFALTAKSAEIPDSVTTLGKAVFGGKGDEDVTVYCSRNSAAWKWAVDAFDCEPAEKGGIVTPPTPDTELLEVLYNQIPTLTGDIIDRNQIKCYGTEGVTDAKVNFTVNENQRFDHDEVNNALCFKVSVTAAAALPVTVTFPIPAGIDWNDLVLLRYDVTDRVWEDAKPVVDKAAGTVTFVLETVECEYVIAETAPTDYITILKSNNGEIIPSVRHAEAGERVTLNVHPDKGYELDELTVTDRRGRDIALRALGDSAYTFLMPNVRVTVEATFKAIKDTTTPETTDPAEQEFNSLGTPGISGIVLNPAAMPYTDVKGPDWFYNNVEYMWKHYLMSGVSDTQFAPNPTTNRGMIWTILARMNNVRTDINPGSTWYEKGMLWCKEQGITDGTNPLSDITREQLVTMLWRNAGKQSGSGDLSKFSDSADVSEYAVTAMRWAVGNGILNGENGQINPQGTATRAQVAAMVARYGDKIVR